MSYFVYILECADNTLYTGCTNNLEKRLIEHNTGKTGAKYTRARRPVKLVFSEPALNLSAALKREAAIKKLSKSQKNLLIKKQP